MDKLLSKNMSLFGGIFEHHPIPNHTEQALDQYILDGIEPSGFYLALLNGKLYDAVQKADHWNTDSFGIIVKWILTNAPIGCYSKVPNTTVIEDWCSNKDNIRTNYTDEIVKKHMWDKLNDRD